jgi:ribosomal 50S subunit-recycling heat shock protein
MLLFSYKKLTRCQVRKVVKMTTLTLEQKITKAAYLVAEGKLVSFRGASADTYMKVMQLANRIKQEQEFPQCPCGECE